MKGFCSDCCLLEEYSQPSVIWYGVQTKQNEKKDFAKTALPHLPINQIKTISNNIRTLKESKSIPSFLTSVGSPRTITRNQMSYSIPILQGQGAIVKTEQGLKDERIRNLQQQNRQYMLIINNELIPLKRDYNHLRQQYQSKLKVVQKMDIKLRQIQRIYEQKQSKSSVGSYMTRI